MAARARGKGSGRARSYFERVSGAGSSQSSRHGVVNFRLTFGANVGLRRRLGAVGWSGLKLSARHADDNGMSRGV